jgi:hypothetical protein
MNNAANGIYNYRNILSDIVERVEANHITENSY